MAEVVVKNKRVFCRSSHTDVFCKEGPLKYFVKLTGKHVYRSLNFFLNWAVGLQLYLKRGSCVCFFPWNFQNFSEQLFSAVNRCLWFNWILGNFDHHLRFRQMPENFDHHSWFYKKYLKFRRSCETIRKPYLEHDIVKESCVPEKYLFK